MNVDAGMSKDEMHLTFTQANESFSKANETVDSNEAQDLYKQAILGYEQIIESGGIHNSKLYTNLANGYLLTDELGKAILNYRRAQWLDSSNPDIHKNLNFARSKRLDQFTVPTKTKILRRLFFWHYDFTMQTRFMIGGVCCAIFCIWLSMRIWLVKWPAAVLVCCIMLVLIVCMVTSVMIEQYTLAKYRSGVIVANSVIARQGDGNNYPKSFNEPLNSGVEFDVLEQRPGWIHIKLSNGQNTWIPDNSAELI